MSFDSSRFTFNPWNDFSGVMMQQGRVQLDSDWNEWLAEIARRVRAGTMDTIGRAVYPSTTPNAFLITPTGGSISIGVGRMYVDGLLAENHGLPAPQSGGWAPPSPAVSGTQPAWDPALDELVGQNAIDYTQQPYFPGVAAQAPFPTSGGPFLVYLDVRLRELTFLEYPDLIEKAVGIDTTGRIQTAWQVRLLDVSSAGNINCGTKDSDIGPWEALLQPSAGRLTTGVVQSTQSGPCCLAPNTGYTGQENQLYRVEIHRGGPSSPSQPAMFKWSRDNASVATAVTGIAQSGKVLTVQSTGKDSVLRFSPNDWVEITDDWLELNGQPGELHQIALVSDSARTITLSTGVSATSFPVDGSGNTDPTRHTRLVRWDQKGKVYQSDGTTVWTDLDVTGTGEIPVPPAGTSLILENGITVSFDLNPGTGQFKVADYWTFAARTADGTVENLVEAPPQGIHHHYARLAILTLPDTKSDCRVEWPPTEGGGCDCGSCVTAQSHNDGSWTIQNGIDAVVTQGGGKVCLGPGVYNIAQTIVIEGLKLPVENLAICGHGLPMLLPGENFSDSIMRINDAIDVTVEGISFAGGVGSVGGAGISAAPTGITIGQTSFVTVERCSFGLITDTGQLTPAIAFNGPLIIDCAIRGNLFNNVRLGIALGNVDRCLLNKISIEDNQMFCIDGAVFLAKPDGLLASEVRFAENFVQSTSGFVLMARGIDVSVEDNTFAIAASTSGGNLPYNGAVLSSCSQTRVANNEIGGANAALGVTTTAGGGSLSAGTYGWLVTAVDLAGRETAIAGPAALTLSGPANAILTWATFAGASSYRVYRTPVNAANLQLDGSVAQGSGADINYTDTVSDGNLQTPLPALQSDGIVLGSPSSSSSLYGCQITGNHISGLVGIGVSMLDRTLMLETLIAQNQLLNLGGNGIVMAGEALDIDILANSIAFVGQLPVADAIIAGIELRAVINGNLSENKIEVLGPPAVAGKSSRRAIFVTLGSEVRIAGNRIADIGPTAVVSAGILAVVLGRLDVSDNDVRRATIPPAQPDQSIWLALAAAGVAVNVQGNLLESFGGTPQAAATVIISAQQGCTFSNNQCFLDDPSGGNSPVLVTSITAQAIIASGNLVKGPTLFTSGAPAPPSLALNVPATKILPMTAVGNITSNGIFVNNSPLAAPWAPLNVQG
ncbi:MAG TPA: DUF6519 domain-containing protein [Terriglobales bacterium]|nr:DUF6519 domain-containing protein [Terriglobales bacterium]